MDHDSPQNVTWFDGDRRHRASWRSATGAAPPREVEVIHNGLKPDDALRLASHGTGMLWTGGFRDARTLLDQLRRRLDSKRLRPSTDPAELFYRHRQRRGTRARLLGMLLVRLDAGGVLDLPDAPDARDACRDAYGRIPDECVVSLQELLGALSARQWYRRGVPVRALDDRIHPHYGVFSPTRDEYVDLIASATLPRTELALDIGTGTGVLAAVLARRGVPRIVAGDNSPRAVACARDNLRRLGLDGGVEVRLTDLFPPLRADLVVCNPPWIPATPSSALDAAVFDPGGELVRRFLRELPEHLRPGGQGWLILSDFAESLGLRTRAELFALIDDAGLRVIDRTETRPRHGRATGHRDPLARLRAAERVSLWRLEPRN